MIINRNGAEFEYNGVKYVVGGRIVGTNQSEYEGLFGIITEIRDGEDKDTENETPDIYCSFDPPVLPGEVKRLEEIFSDLYDMPKTIDDIILDCVIMAPEMVQPITGRENNSHKQKVYLVEENWAIGAECGHSVTLFANYIHARLELHRMLLEEQENGCIPRWKDRIDFQCESDDSHYECCLDRDYCENHYEIALREDVIYLSETDRDQGSVSVMLRIHHHECDCEDDLITFVCGDQATEKRIYPVFVEGLRRTEKESEGCRFTWLDLARAYTDEVLGTRSYEGTAETDAAIDLFYGMFQK